MQVASVYRLLSINDSLMNRSKPQLGDVLSLYYRVSFMAGLGMYTKAVAESFAGRACTDSRGDDVFFSHSKILETDVGWTHALALAPHRA
jgi:hypothetical protein